MTICQNTIMKGLTSLQQISKVLYLHFVSCIQQIRLEKQKFLFVDKMAIGLTDL